MNLEEALKRIERDTADIKAALAGQVGLLEADQKLLREILEAVTPAESAEGGVSLSELLAELIMQLRDQSQKLASILAILTRSPPDGGPSAEPAAPLKGWARGSRT